MIKRVVMLMIAALIAANLLMVEVAPVSAAVSSVSSITDATTWSKRYSGISVDKAYSAIQSSDGGFVVAGFARKIVADWLPYEWDRLHVVKFDAYGRLLWNRFYSNDRDNRAFCIIQTSDGGYAIAGEKHSPITRAASSGYDFWLIKTDSSGIMQRNKTYGEQVPQEGAYSVIQTSDGGYALAGYLDDQSYFVQTSLVIKVDATGNLEWSKRFGEGTLAHSIVQTENNGYAICGEKTQHTYSGDIHQAFLVRTDSLGNKFMEQNLWRRRYLVVLNG
jgi:hypothetical protein